LLKSQLSPLQEMLLAAFFRRDQRFFLTGGAALAGFFLGHRRTADLDLFTTPSPALAGGLGPLDAGDAALQAAAQEIGATIENIQTFPEFRQRLVKRGDDRVMVDLVVDRAAQGYPDKRLIGDVRVDPPEEIMANKLCTLLSRTEPRDLVDVLALERAGLRAEDALPLAARKDGGITPAALAWVLSQIEIDPDTSVPLPGGVSPAELRTFLEDLISRLTRLSYPDGSGNRASG
jgi:Nucleotidyl transferase AbiEii toxin, Type IV TA system